MFTSESGNVFPHLFSETRFTGNTLNRFLIFLICAVRCCLHKAVLLLLTWIFILLFDGGVCWENFYHPELICFNGLWRRFSIGCRIFSFCWTQIYTLYPIISTLTPMQVDVVNSFQLPYLVQTIKVNNRLREKENPELVFNQTKQNHHQQKFQHMFL